MSSRTYLGRSMQRFTSSPQFDGYSKVIITVSDEIEYSAGNDTGRALLITNPWVTPQMAQDILNDIQGFQYQPYTAESALIDPSAELGDGVTANNVYGGIYTQKIKFGPLLTATVAAPEGEELNHEYPYKSRTNKEITREAKQLRASLKIEADRITQEVTERKSAVEQLTAQLQVQAGLIEAKVSKTGGDNTSFGWNMTDTYMLWQANGTTIFKLDKTGADVLGKIVAKSGKIGGFDILENYLSYNNQTWGGTNSVGIYAGPQGIQCGKDLKLFNTGRIEAKEGFFQGTIYAGKIAYGDNAGYLSGSGISTGSVYGNRLVGGTVTTAYTSSGINSALARGESAYDVLFGNAIADAIACDQLSADQILLNGRAFGMSTIAYVGTDGNNHSINVVTWRYR